MKESCKLTETFPVSPSTIYEAWLSSEGHIAMTGGEANCNNIVGGAFDAWDGYIEGKNLELVENQKIVQSWRTTEFAPNDEDSIVTIELIPSKKGSELVLTHTNIPEG